MTAIISGSAPSVQFSDGTTQTTSAIVSGYVPYVNLPAGSVLQVVSSTYTTQVTTTSTTNVDTGLTATITPKYSTSKILVLAMNNVGSTNSAGVNSVSYFDTLRGSTVLVHTRFQIGNALASGTNAVVIGPISIQYMDSPATTSATTYKMQMATNETSITATSAINGNAATMILMEIAA